MKSSGADDGRRPAMLCIFVTSRASSSVIGGRIEGIRRASMDFPVPGGPTINILWPPETAISIARFAISWPLTSAKSGSEE